MNKLALGVLVFLSCVSFSFAKDQEWNNGTLLSYDQQTFTTYSQNKGTGRDVPHTTYRVQIDAGNRIFFAERTLNFAWQKFPKVTENGPLSWSLKGSNELMIRDDKGKEFTLTIVKTRLKSSEPPKN
jgi:hypothetical protein